ncbi:MAG: hypothetical protein JWO44_2744 [Bacteroidetes bacterium]|nr:hypothetical protein [Bacteroidota bacterium]
MRKITFILSLFICATCSAQMRSGFYSNFTIYNKADDTLQLIENKLLQSLEAAKKANKYPPFTVYSYYPGWRMELTLNEICLNGNAQATNDYSLSMEWRNQNVDSGFVTGLFKDLPLGSSNAGRQKGSNAAPPPHGASWRVSEVCYR